MIQTVNRRWKVLQAPTGFPVIGKDITLVTEPTPTEIGDNEILVRVKWMSLDPYMRGTMNEESYGVRQSYPRVMVADGVGEVVESKIAQFKVGDVVTGPFGWQDYAVSNGQRVFKVSGEFPLSYYVGVLGMPGATAYFGFLEICNPQPGETVVVSAATGAVGQLVGQIAKIKGCHVIGFAGGEEKCKWALSVGYDACLNYRNKTEEQLSAELKSLTPNGIHCYFDNTGGICSEVVFPLLALRGRVSVCGQIAYYNTKEPPKTAPLTLFCLKKQLKVEGFIVSSRWDRTKEWPACHAQLAEWIKEKKLVVREQVVEGLENAFDSFLTLFQDAPTTKQVNFGKLVVKL